MIGIDTTVLIDIVKGNLDPKRLRKDQTFCTTATNIFELEIGLKSREKDIFQAIKKAIVILPFTAESSHKATNTYKQLKKQGKDIGKFDCMIAGCLLSHNVTSIITHNTKHFEKIKELKVISV